MVFVSASPLPAPGNHTKQVRWTRVPRLVKGKAAASANSQAVCRPCFFFSPSNGASMSVFRAGPPFGWRAVAETPRMQISCAHPRNPRSRVSNHPPPPAAAKQSPSGVWHHRIRSAADRNGLCSRAGNVWRRKVMVGGRRNSASRFGKASHPCRPARPGKRQRQGQVWAKSPARSCLRPSVLGLPVPVSSRRWSIPPSIDSPLIRLARKPISGNDMIPQAGKCRPRSNAKLEHELAEMIGQPQRAPNQPRPGPEGGAAIR